MKILMVRDAARQSTVIMYDKHIRISLFSSLYQRLFHSISVGPGALETLIRFLSK